MSTRIIDVAETLRSMAKALKWTEQGEACEFALRVLEERCELQKDADRHRESAEGWKQTALDLARYNKRLHTQIARLKKAKGKA